MQTYLTVAEVEPPAVIVKCDPSVYVTPYRLLVVGAPTSVTVQ